METTKTTAMGLGTKSAQDFVLARVGERFLRFGSVDLVPTGSQPITLATLEGMPKDLVEDIYSKVAGIMPKTFKDKGLAVSSLAYQVGKMQLHDPAAPAAPQLEEPRANVRPTKAERATRKGAEVFELLTISDFGKVTNTLAPQARELVAIMVELAREKGSTTFTGAELQAKLQEPASLARLKTKQDPLRVLAYYTGRMIGAGLIRTS